MIRQGLPSQLVSLFHNYRPETIDLDRHSELVIMTVATHGTWDDLRWMYHYYGPQRVGEVIEKDINGARELPVEVANFWSVRLWRRPLKPPTKLERWGITVPLLEVGSGE